MKKAIIAFSVLLILIISLGAGAFLWWQNVSSAPNVDKTPKKVVIKRGSNAEDIATALKTQGIIKNAFAFKLYTQIRNYSGKIQAGEFSLPTNATLPEVVNLLLSGPTEVWVTIPEGFRREQVALRFANTFELDQDSSDKFVSDFLSASANLEGYLFPDTYLFAKDASASAVVKYLNSTFEKKIDSSMRDGITQSGRSLKDIVTLASILERETKGNAEKPIVAGIILKRIAAGWPIQADASVQYVLASRDCKLPSTFAQCDWWPQPTREDLQLPSPYNTYKNSGLPPGPIANPGLASLKAAIAPQESDYWFYIHDEAGKIYYAKTLDEHNTNIAKYLK